jgi:hypothetical protein
VSALVDAVAKELEELPGEGYDCDPWENLPEIAKEAWRRSARHAIKAVEAEIDRWEESDFDECKICPARRHCPSPTGDPLCARTGVFLSDLAREEATS